jgi:D-3-phosphoglycerate dehydrogenase
MKRMKALFLENIHPYAEEILRRCGIDITSFSNSLSESELISQMEGTQFLGIRSRTQITNTLLENSPDLLAIGAYCIGTNQIDLDSASLKGVVAFNAPYSNTRSVAEIVMAEIIFLIRRLYEKIRYAHQGVWDKSAENTHEVRGKSVGIIGYGNIGSQVSMLAESMGMKVYYYDIIDKLTIGNAVRLSSLDELLKISDIVTVHVDGNAANRNLIGAGEFSKMKNGVIFLNLSRGIIVDIDAMAANIKNGKIAGAAVDVFPEEPRSPDDKFFSPLQNLPNVLLTPHIGGNTEEAQYNIAEFVSNKLIEYFKTGSTFTSVNFPRIQLPSLTGSHRLLHIHKNLPGVLSQINTIFARNSVNVESQFLRTNENIGYVVTDVDKKYKDSLLEDLKNVDHTIKVRILN